MLIVVVFIISLLFNALSSEMVEQLIAERMQAYSMRLSDELTEEQRRQAMDNHEEYLRDFYGTEDPFYVRVTRTTKDTLSFNLGTSHTDYYYGAEDGRVTTIIMHYLPRTILLFSSAAITYIILGIAIGLKTAQVAGSKIDKFVSIFGIVTSSMPMWWVGMLVILIFAYELGWFPASSLPFPDSTGLAYYKGVMHRMAMPLGTIVFVAFGARAWTTRNMVTSVLQDDYIMAARAKGVPENRVIYGHTLKTASPPIITSAILAFLLSIGGAMITEVIFNWPGMGFLLRAAIFQNSDLPVIMGIVFITTVLWVVGYLIADLLYGYLDPRVEVGAEKRV
ncbi:MAG: ABC transporter permease [Thermoplasmata archaeon]